MGLYKWFKGEKESEKEQNEESFDLELKTRINLIKNQTRVRTYKVTGPLNHDVSNLILGTNHPVIEIFSTLLSRYLQLLLFNLWGAESSCSVPQDVVSQ